MRKNRSDQTALLYVLPAFTPLFLFWLLPLAGVLFLSFMDWDFISTPKWVGIHNYQVMFQNPEFIQSLWVTIYFTIGSIIPAMVGGLLIALLLYKKMKASGLYQTLIFSPWVTPTVAVSVVFSWIFNSKNGLANAILQFLHLHSLPWLDSPTWAMPVILIVTIWKGLGWSMVFYIVALRGIPQGVREAAALDGANARQTFWHVILPKISPTSFFLFIMLIIESLQAYDQINVLTQGGPAGSTRTMLYLYYEAGFQQSDIGQASAIAMLLVVIASLLSLISFGASKRWVNYD